MDKAVIGYMRIGYFRIGVFDNKWDKLIAKYQKMPTPNKIIVDGPAVTVDGAETFRVDTFTEQWEKLKKRFKI